MLIRGSSRLRQRLGDTGTSFLEFAAGAVQRLLPQLQVSAWKKGPLKVSSDGDINVYHDGREFIRV